MSDPYAPPPEQGASPASGETASSMSLTPFPHPVRPLDALGTALVVLLSLHLAFAAAQLMAELALVSLYDRSIDDPAFFNDDRVLAAEGLYGLIAIGELLLFAGTGVVFMIWVWRARTNADVYGTADHVRDKGWVIAGWLIPVVNLWFPYQIVRDVWAASVPAEPDGGHGRRGRVPGLILGWWMCWLAWGFLRGAVWGRAGTFEDGITPQQAYDSNLWDIAETVALVLSAALCLFVVRGLTRLQSQRNGELLAAIARGRLGFDHPSAG